MFHGGNGKFAFDRDGLGNSLRDLLKGLVEAQRERLASYNEEKSQLQFRHKTGQISEKQYYEALAKIRDKYLDKAPRSPSAIRRCPFQGICLAYFPAWNNTRHW